MAVDPLRARHRGPSRLEAVLEAVALVAAVALVVVMHRLGIVGPLPLWVLLGTMAVAVLACRPTFHRVLSGGDLTRGLWLRVPLNLAAITPISYLTGWGPMTPIAFLIVSLIHLRWSGSRAWLPAAAGSLAAIGAAQAGIALGVVPSYLPPLPSQSIAVFSTISITLVLAYLGAILAGREQAERSLAAEERRFRKLVHNSSDLIVLADADGRIVWISPSAGHLLGRSGDDVLGSRVETLLDAADRPLGDTLRSWAGRPSALPLHLEWRLQRADRSSRWYDVEVQNLLDDPDVRGLLINQRDVTDTRLARERLVHDATHDALTGLLNRGAFLDRLHGTIDRSGGGYSVLYLDLNSFKPINDHYGHEAGDAVLASVAEAIRASILGTDVAARIGGDEFAVLLPGLRRPEDVEAVARRLAAAVRLPLQVEGEVLVPEAAIGVVTVTGAVLDAREVLRRADRAMYRAKRERSAWASYGEEQDRVAGPA